MTVYARTAYNVDAIQYTGSNQSALRDFGVTFTSAPGVFVVTTSEDNAVEVAVGDYIVRWADKTVSIIPQAEFEADFTVVP